MMLREIMNYNGQNKITCPNCGHIFNTTDNAYSARKKRDAAALKYKPNPIKYLLIAEAPPADLSRYFYFEEMIGGDGFYFETMNALYSTNRFDPKFLRKNKEKFLNCFKRDGFYLIDACEEPMESKDRSYKEKQIEKYLPDLKSRILGFACPAAKIILIVATVHSICLEELKQEGFCVINKRSIPFPGTGNQGKFREHFLDLLRDHGWAQGDCGSIL
jgi:hypothetical protein